MTTDERTGTSIQTKSATTFESFVCDIYWPTIKGVLSPSWAETAERYHLPRLVKHFGKATLGAIQPEDVEGWWSTLRGEKVVAATANKLLFRLKHIFKKAVEREYITQSPARFLKRAREPRCRVRFFSDEQRRQLIEQANANLQLYILAAVYTGGRRRSLLHLRQRDINWDQGEITFCDTKNGEDYRVPLHPILRAALEPRRTAQGNEYVLPRYQPAALSRAFKRLTLRLGFEDYRFHDTRHDVASRLAVAGANQRMIMEVLGHKDLRSSMRYTHLTRAAVESAMLGALT
jgi:integrase